VEPLVLPLVVPPVVVPVVVLPEVVPVVVEPDVEPDVLPVALMPLTPEVVVPCTGASLEPVPVPVSDGEVVVDGASVLVPEQEVRAEAAHRPKAATREA
jgi:hypothetical protein